MILVWSVRPKKNMILRQLELSSIFLATKSVLITAEVVLSKQKKSSNSPNLGYTFKWMKLL